DGNAYLADTWEWDGNTWSMRSISGPPARCFHGMATLGGKVLLFGGQNDAGIRNDTWEWDGMSWAERRLMVAPLPRNEFAMATLADNIVLFGGSSTGQVFGDTWEWDGRTWTQRNLTGPPARTGSEMAALGGRLMLFGGNVVRGPMFVYFSDTWEWNG